MATLFTNDSTHLAHGTTAVHNHAWMQHEAEAPDRGDLHREAPESRDGRTAEAPDAGEGRMNTLENEFTHGRSQS